MSVVLSYEKKYQTALRKYMEVSRQRKIRRRAWIHNTKILVVKSIHQIDLKNILHPKPFTFIKKNALSLKCHLNNLL